jgi:putative nucleotidyltransferase with HDIG domain
LYRVQQFVRAAGSWIRPDDADTALAARYLPPEAVKLFLAMSRYDRQHALKVAQSLVGQGHTERDLLAAALLHDAGKTVTQEGRVRLWHRVAVVLMHVSWPDLLERLARGGRQGWRRPFYVQLTHAAIGAEAAEQAGCSEVTVDLIRRHEDAPGQTHNPLLAALQAADSEN